MPKIVLRLVGGLGNQLFEYAAARRLAYVNDVRLYLDTISGFERDPYKRSYSLQHFNIQAQLAGRNECYAGTAGRLARYCLRKLDRAKPAGNRRFIRESGHGSDVQLLDLKVAKDIYLEGLWQDERYFWDIEPVLREDFRIVSPLSTPVRRMSETIEGATQAVCIHVRRLYHLGESDEERALSIGFGPYRAAVDHVCKRVTGPCFYIFSDDSRWAENVFVPDVLEGLEATVVDAKVDGADYEVLHMMSRCKHFILSYSTFGWWGAWLADYQSKIVLVANKKPERTKLEWNSRAVGIERGVIL
jgi:hypothetical protein